MPADFVQRYAAISSGYWAARAADDDSPLTRDQNHRIKLAGLSGVL